MKHLWDILHRRILECRRLGHRGKRQEGSETATDAALETAALFKWPREATTST